jgi:tetratricopeptide (TPR) repeat protein
MTLPKGWGVSLPPALHAKSEWARLDETYDFDKGVLRAERRLVVVKEHVPQAQWKEYAKFAEEAKLGEERWVVVLPHDADTGDSSSETIEIKGGSTVKVQKSGSSISDLPAEAQLRYFHMMKNSMGPKGNELMLQKLQEKFPDAEGLWSAYAELAVDRKDYAAAIEDYRKELSLHPKEYAVYGQLAEAQLSSHQPDDAEKTLKAWVDADSKSVDAPIRLTEVFLEDDKPIEAAKTVQDGLARVSSGDSREGKLNVLYGRAALRTGDKEEGRKALVSAIKSAVDSEVANDAAHALADAGLELTLAEVSAAQNINRMEQESQGWTLMNYPLTMETRQQLLESTWETMALVLYREGKASEAESYASAVWKGLPAARVGKLLGDIEAAEGKRERALNTYHLAMGQSGSDAEKKAVRDAIDALEKAGVNLQEKSPAQAPGARIPAGPAGDLDGLSASSYRVLLSATKVEAVQRTGSTWVRGGEDKVSGMTFPGLFPIGSKARLVRTAKLICEKKTCEVELYP